MTSYFGVSPTYSSVSGNVNLSLSFNGGSPLRRFVSNSERIIVATREDSPLDMGSLVTPTYDSEDTLASGEANPFTNPRYNELDRIEKARELGFDAAESARLASASSYSSPGSLESPESPATASE